MTEGVLFARILAYYGLIENNNEATAKIICPFHEDVNPSMICDLERGSYFCFGCDERGGTLDFVMKIENANGLQACRVIGRILADTGLRDIKERTYKERESDEDLLMRARDYYYCLEQPNWESKHLDKEYTEVRDYMLKRGFTKQLLNLAEAKYTYNNSYPIVFPVFDNKEFKGWQSRTIDPEIEKKRKYFNNKGFSRASTLAGTYDKGSTVIIVEGYMDMLKIKQFGVRNVVALFGWKMSREQLRKLQDNNITHVISALDNDEYGRKGTLFLRRYFNVTRWKYLKGVKDPGDFTEETFIKMYNKTRSA